MKQLSNVRKADKAHGDDLSLTRWVKEPGRHTKPSRTGLAPADASRTRFPTRVLRVADMTNLLVSGHSNVKIGDFYSAEYVDFWRRMLDEHANLSIFGYTARNNEDPIGEAVIHLRHQRWDRFAIRSSNGARHNKATVSIKTEADCPASAFVCPEQTGKTICCATCGACWSTTKNVAFLEH